MWEIQNGGSVYVDSSSDDTDSLSHRVQGQRRRESDNHQTTSHRAITGPASGPGAVRTQTNVYQFKVVLIGECGVGKSSLGRCYDRQQFNEFQCSTIGAALLTPTVHLDDATVKFELWDTAGQEQYHCLIPMYYRGAQAAIVVYDITSQDSFDRAKSWVNELRRQASRDILIALAGNKADLANQRTVIMQEAVGYAEENGLLFMETSAKTGLNVNTIFMDIAKQLPKVPKGSSGSGLNLRHNDDNSELPHTWVCCS